ncbi:TPA: protein kinase domain-containing protein, partial [Legionella anisa]
RKKKDLNKSTIIDPAYPKNKSEKKLIAMIIAQEEKQYAGKDHKISKTIPGKASINITAKSSIEIQGKKIQLTNSLIKFNGEYLVIKDKIGEGSMGNKVKVLPVIYKKNRSGKYVYKPLEKTDECVIKVCKPHWNHYDDETEKDGWKRLKTSAKHECEMLKESGDKNAGLFIDEGRHKVYIKSTKAPGLPLDKYLVNNPDLSIQERLLLIHLINRAVLDLHAKNIYHLDLKLENIFFDPSTKKVTLIDFGSAIKLTPQEVSKSLEEVTKDITLHMTTPFLEPAHKKQNSAGQIDSFSMAGIHGLILSDWTNDQVWTKKPVMQKKGRAVILFDEPEYRKYDFNSLISKTPSYLKDEDHKLLASIVAELNNLGHDEKEQRISLQQFQTKMTDSFMIKSSQQESLTDQVLPSPSITAKFKEIKRTLLDLSFKSKKEEQNTEIELPK